MPSQILRQMQSLLLNQNQCPHHLLYTKVLFLLFFIVFFLVLNNLIEKYFAAADTVFLLPHVDDHPPYNYYVARIVSINDTTVLVNWFYHPEETVLGRQPFHGVRELYASDHRDLVPIESLDGHCTVHTFPAYLQLEIAGDGDFYFRSHYSHTDGIVTPIDDMPT